METKRENMASKAVPAIGSPRVAVIELGTSSVRMALAQVSADGSLDPLEFLQQAVSLGKDTFTKGYIERDTTEECVKALRSFRRKLQEYRVDDERQIKAVATSAVREAANRDAFLDRIFIATGIHVEAIDEAEVNRYTYLAVHPLLLSEPDLKRGDVLVIEVGAGNTEVLTFHHDRIGNPHTYRMGALRLRKTLEDYRAPVVRLREIMESSIDRVIGQMKAGMAPMAAPSMLALGGDARFACSLLEPGWDRKGVARLKVDALSKLTDRLLRMSTDEVVRKHNLSYAEAETLGPALLAYVRVAEALRLKNLFVGRATLRDGVLIEMASRGLRTEEYRRQMVNSALELGKKYDFARRHAEFVAEVSRKIFQAMQDEHRLGPRHEAILTIAALLHDIGLFVSNRSHHTHSYYLILNSDIFGLGAADQRLTAAIARYHRKALPQPTHEEYDALDRESRIIVSKIAAILRVADAMDRGHAQRCRKFHISVEPGRLGITMERAGDLAVEEFALQEKGQMFEQVYGMKVVFRGSDGGDSHGKG